MPPSFCELVRVFGRIGLLSFGGPAAQIALMHRELVDRRPWLDERSFLNALSFCMLLPGPEATQLATYAGWRLRGTWGGVLAGVLFVLPGALVIFGLAAGYALWGDLPLIMALFLGVKATVVIVVVEALIRVARRALVGHAGWIIAALSFVAIFALRLPFPLIIALAGAWGAWRAKTALAPGDDPPLRPRTLRTVAIWLAIWAAPVALLAATDQALLLEIAGLFSKLAVVTFGGAYAVLAYMTQEVVAQRGWLSTEQMMDALGLAETTPGPLILVTQFVAFMAGFAADGIALGILAGAVALWVTFVPCFLWIFAGAPYLDWIATRPRLTGALGAITAAVVGVILNLSVWFAAHVFFDSVGTATLGPLRVILPDPLSMNLAAVVLALCAGALLLWRHWPLPAVLGTMALAGAAIPALGWA
ncbi:chromate efflux transporter [Oceaniglobus trochenteri]|uniref:chromate efflux transporter n=1 Tax=Oceaniglobus trochenteri TaxID=2763260 RepID=UPI001CFFFED4|nr:chromate efflux transporter [Oceaniglobus trochenteri]